MHTFIILGDDIYTLDTAEERDLAAGHMRDAKVDRLTVYVGGPTNADEDGRMFSCHGHFVQDETIARMTAAYRGEL
jgi:hypothetical protein